MPSLARALLVPAFAALALAAFPMLALAQSGTDDSGRLAPPRLIDPSDGGAEVIADKDAVPLEDRNSPPVPVDGDAGKEVDAGDSKKSDAKGKYGLIDQYPQNPRCYVAGRYIPAPPTCPN